jgi:hypothetical protein
MLYAEKVCHMPEKFQCHSDGAARNICRVLAPGAMMTYNSTIYCEVVPPP